MQTVTFTPGSSGTYWESDPDFVTYWTGCKYIACYRHEEPGEFNGEAFGEGPARSLAIADLVLHYPREA